MKIKYQSLEKITRWEAFQLLNGPIAFTDNTKDRKGELYLTIDKLEDKVEFEIIQV